MKEIVLYCLKSSDKFSDLESIIEFGNKIQNENENIDTLNAILDNKTTELKTITAILKYLKYTEDYYTSKLEYFEKLIKGISMEFTTPYRDQIGALQIKYNELILKLKDKILKSQLGSTSDVSLYKIFDDCSSSDYADILNYLQNNKFNTFYTNTGEKFKLCNVNINNKKDGSSIYIGAGFYSCVFGIEQIEPIPPQIDDKLLVCKLQIVRKRTKDELVEWHKVRREMYDYNTENFGTLIPECIYYGNNIVKFGEVDVDIRKGYSCSFDIYKYYTQDVPEGINRENILLKMCVILFYASVSRKCYIPDLKPENIGYTSDYNIVIIDFNEEVFIESVQFGYMKMFNHFIIGPFAPCYFQKELCLFLNLDSAGFVENVKTNLDILQHSNPDIDSIKLLQMIFNNMIKSRLESISKLVHKEKRYIMSTYFFTFDLFNILTIVMLIFKFFFTEETTNTFSKFMRFGNFGKPVGNLTLNGLDQNTQNLLKLSCSTIFIRINTFQNYNDMFIMNKYIHSYIQSAYGSIPLIMGLKQLLFDPISECGLLGADRENVCSFKLVFRKLLMLFERNHSQDVSLFMDYFRLNIDAQRFVSDPRLLKTEEEYYASYDEFKYVDPIIVNICEKLGILNKLNITYEIWCFCRLIQQIRNTLEYRTHMNILKPSTRSTLPQSIFEYTDTDGTIKTVIKWIPEQHTLTENIDSTTKFIENPVYSRLRQEGKVERLSEETIRLNNENIRKNALMIVAILAGTTNILPSIPDLTADIHQILNTPWTNSEIQYEIPVKLLEPRKIRDTEKVDKYTKEHYPKSQLSSTSLSYVNFEPDLRKLKLEELKNYTKKHISNRSTATSVRNKYLKYKQKYIQLKQLINKNSSN